MAWTTTTTRAPGFVVTAAVWNDEHVDNLQHLERVGSASQTSDVTITATTVGTAQTIVSAGAITYEAVSHRFEVFLPRLSSGNGALHVIFKRDSTVLGTLLDGIASESEQGRTLVTYDTPTAASHTYLVAAWRAAGTDWIARAGTGGTTGDSTTFLPITLKVTREVV